MKPRIVTVLTNRDSANIPRFKIFDNRAIYCVTVFWRGLLGEWNYFYLLDKVKCLCGGVCKTLHNMRGNIFGWFSRGRPTWCYEYYGNEQESYYRDKISKTVFYTRKYSVLQSLPTPKISRKHLQRSVGTCEQLNRQKAVWIYCLSIGIEFLEDLCIWNDCNQLEKKGSNHHRIIFREKGPGYMRHDSIDPLVHLPP